MSLKEQALEVFLFLRDQAGFGWISMEDLEKPMTKRIQPLYQWLVQYITACDESEISIHPFLQKSDMKYPELFNVAAPIVVISLSVNRILQDIHFGEAFFIPDLLKPQSDKTIRVLHKLVSFATAISKRKHVVEGICAKRAEAVEKMNRMKEEREELKERINALRIRLAERRPIADKLRQQDRVLDEEIKKRKEKTNAMNKEAETAEKEVNKLKEAYLASCRESERLRAEVQKLSSQLVKSPEKLKNEIADLEREKSTAGDRLRQVAATITDQTDKKANLAKVEHTLDSLMKNVDELAREKSKLDAAKEAGEKAGGEIKILHTSVQSAIRGVERKRVDLKTLETRSKATKKRTEPKVEELRQKMAHMTSDMARLKRETNTDKSTSAAAAKSIDAIRCDLKKLDDDHAAYEDQCLEDVTKVFEAHERIKRTGEEFFEQLNADMKKEWGMDNPPNQEEEED